MLRSVRQAVPSAFGRLLLRSAFEVAPVVESADSAQSVPTMPTREATVLPEPSGRTTAVAVSTVAGEGRHPLPKPHFSGISKPRHPVGGRFATVD